MTTQVENIFQIKKINFVLFFLNKKQYADAMLI